MTEQPNTQVSIPLDDDGFLRRACPTCEREFKWLHTGDEEAIELDPAGCFCPYCGVQAPTDAWLTEGQADYMRTIAMRRFGGPLLDQFAQSGFKVEPNLPDEPPELTEENDMVRVDFACHPQMPLKVREDWALAPRCLICGQPRGD